MEALERSELEHRLKSAVKEHQQEGLHMVGGVEQLIPRLINAVEEWLQSGPQARLKSA